MAGTAAKMRIEWRSPAARRRIISLLLALALQALFVLALLHQAFPPTRRGSSSMLTIDIKPPPPPTPLAKHPKAAAKTNDAVPKSPPRPAPIVPPLAHPLPTTNKMVVVTREDFNASDISKLASHKGEGNQGSGRSAAAYGPGEGPGGGALYGADWYREPLDGELALYLPAKQPGAWGEIECQTIAHYHVHNCRMLRESPPGSGISRGLRQAAYQFLIRPPRVGDKPVIGAWVRIHFDFIKGIR